MRVLIVLIAGYLNSFAVDYRDVIVLVTISAITPLAITNGSVKTVLERIFYVGVGTILALLANIFILRKNLILKFLKKIYCQGILMLLIVLS